MQQNLKTHHNFEKITNKFRNSSTSNKMHFYCASPSITPKHTRHMHLQKILFYTKFATHTKFSLAITSNVNNDPPNRSMNTELFPTQEINVRKRTKNVSVCASRINIEMDVLTNQLTAASQHETNTGNSLAILNSNIHDDE